MVMCTECEDTGEMFGSFPCDQCNVNDETPEERDYHAYGDYLGDLEREEA